MGRPFAPSIITSDKSVGGATIEKSVSLNDADSVRFHRTGTQGVDGNRRVHTVSMWMKKTVNDNERHFFQQEMHQAPHIMILDLKIIIN